MPQQEGSRGTVSQPATLPIVPPQDDANELTSVGPYRVTRRIGTGGMGDVYFAEQYEPVRRQVAIKVLRTGLDTDDIVARFRAEQQTLAMMEHPNITRVYDAGATPSGRPYFVMEFVVGETLDGYASSRRLTLRARVALLVQVCRAVQHAHQKGVIHRDIKPSNVIVTETDGAPVCKVIDFGIARAVTPAPDAARLTMTGVALGTPAYMSPEQFLSGGADVDTRTDIYALGMVLYELLAGVLPFEDSGKSGWLALLAQHAGSDAPRPSSRFMSLPDARRAEIAAERQTDPATLHRALEGDLDCVAGEALERDREHRYATANGLALDLERYLADRPVSAHTASVPYRARKFARRHRWGVAFAATAAVLVAGAAVTGTVQARRIAVARRLAVARQAQAEELIGFMLGDLRDKLTGAGRLDLLDAVGDRAVAYFAAVPESQLSDVERFRRALALQQLGEVRMAQDRLPEAATLMRQSLGISQRLIALDSLNPQWQIGFAHSHFWAGNVDWQRGDVAGALHHFLPFVSVSRALIARFPDSLAYREELVYALNNIGFAREATGDVAAALQSYRAGLALNRDLAARDPTKPEWQVSLANEENAAAVAERKLGDLSSALSGHDREVAIKASLVAHDTANRERLHNLAIGHAYRGELRLLMGDTTGALRDATAARRLYLHLVATDTTDATLQWSLAKSERQLAQVLLEAGDAAGALRALAPARATTARLLARGRANPRVAMEDAVGATVAARATLATGDGVASARLARGAVKRARDILAAKPADVDRHRVAGEAYLALGDALRATGERAASREAWADALASAASAPGDGQQTELLAITGAALLGLGRRAEATRVVGELGRRGYRRPGFVRLTRAAGARAA